MAQQPLQYVERLSANDPAVTELRLEGLRVEGTRYLAEALKINSVLTSLNLGHNNIGVEGSRYLTEALAVHEK